MLPTAIYPDGEDNSLKGYVAVFGIKGYVAAFFNLRCEREFIREVFERYATAYSVLYKSSHGNIMALGSNNYQFVRIHGDSKKNMSVYKDRDRVLNLACV